MNSEQRGGTAGSEQSIGELHFGPSDYLAAERTFSGLDTYGDRADGVRVRGGAIRIVFGGVSVCAGECSAALVVVVVIFWDGVDCYRRHRECIFDLGARAFGAGHESRRG